MMIGGVFFVLLILVGIVIAVWAATQGGKSDNTRASNEAHIDILKRRYANGEINKKQYDEMMKDLMK